MNKAKEEENRLALLYTYTSLSFKDSLGAVGLKSIGLIWLVFIKRRKVEFNALFSTKTDQSDQLY